MDRRARIAGGMNHVFVDRRDGGLRLYLGGELQFDAADEASYHEPLGLVPVALAQRRARRRSLRVLVLGGGDGLALREVLKSPDVAEAHVVDRDPVVLTIARTDLAALNVHAFEDPRVRVHVRDAVDVLTTARDFDVVIVDFTYPRDVAGARLHSTTVYTRLRAALAPGGVAAINAVSPELTPEAFGCLAATIAAAGLRPRPHTFALASFAAEGYGRWGCLFAARDAIEDDDVRALAFPAGSRITSADLLAGADLPRAAAHAMRVGPNDRDELLYHLANATPVAWGPPFERLEPATSARDAGQRLTVAEGFARWLRQPEGRRSLETLLACVPLAQRGRAREWMLEWSQHAESMLRQIDLRAFAERALGRAAALPEAWQRELRELAARVRDGLPSMRDLLESTWRVFAVFLLAMLLANLLFPDNLYAKGGGWSGGGRSSSGSHGSSDGGAAMRFSDSSPSASPFRFRPSPGRTGGYRVTDALGREFEAPPFVFTDSGGTSGPVPSLLALTPDLRLVDGGGVAYFARVPGHHFVLHPDRLDAMTNRGVRVISLHPGPLADTAGTALRSQTPLVERAMADHRRWVAWTEWSTAMSSAPRSELHELERIERAIGVARTEWSVLLRAPALAREADWLPVLPGIFATRGASGGAPPELVLATSDGGLIRRSLDPPTAVTDLERFLFAVMESSGGTWRPGPQVAQRWRSVHGAALDPPPGTLR